jgi:hypothetical protein
MDLTDYSEAPANARRIKKLRLGLPTLNAAYFLPRSVHLL